MSVELSILAADDNIAATQSVVTCHYERTSIPLTVGMMANLPKTYSVWLRRKMVQAGALRGSGWTAEREQAKVLLSAALIGMPAAAFDLPSPVSLVLLIVAAAIALGGTALIIVVGLQTAARAGDKRYNLFTRKRLSAEYQDDDPNDD